MSTAILTRQAARWAVAAEQDRDLFIALLHASYAAAYFLALEHVRPVPKKLDGPVRAVIEAVDQRFQPSYDPMILELGRALVDEAPRDQDLVPWLIDLALDVVGTWRELIEPLAAVVLVNLGMGFVMAVRQIASDSDVIARTGVDPQALETELGAAQLEAMRNASSFMPRELFPSGPLVEIAGHL